MLRTILLASMLMLVSLPLNAAHPLVTDDTGTQGIGRFQLEVNSEFIDNEDGAVDETGGETAVTVSYGIAENIDLILGLPYAWYKVSEHGLTVADENGIGDLSFEVKWRFFEYEDRGLSVALKPSVSFPTGDEKRGLGNGEVSGGTTVLVSKEGVLGSLHLNLGYMRNEYGLDQDNLLLRSNIWHASFAGTINLTASMTGVCDIGIETNPEKGNDDHPAFLLGGVIYSITNDFDINAGVKWGLNDAEADTTWLTGLALRF